MKNGILNGERALAFILLRIVVRKLRIHIVIELAFVDFDPPALRESHEGMVLVAVVAEVTIPEMNARTLIEIQHFIPAVVVKITVRGIQIVYISQIHDAVGTAVNLRALETKVTGAVGLDAVASAAVELAALDINVACAAHINHASAAISRLNPVTEGDTAEFNMTGIVYRQHRTSKIGDIEFRQLPGLCLNAEILNAVQIKAWDIDYGVIGLRDLARGSRRRERRDIVSARLQNNFCSVPDCCRQFLGSRDRDNPRVAIRLRLLAVFAVFLYEEALIFPSIPLFLTRVKAE